MHRSDVSVTHADAQNPPPRRSVTLAPHPPKAHLPLPGFVNAFAISPPKKGKGKAHIEKNQDVHEGNWDPPLPSPSRSPTRAPLRTQADERMEIDRDEVDGQAGVTTYPDVDYGMEPVDDERTVGHIPGSSRTAKPFDWLGWVCSHLLCLPISTHILAIDKTAFTRSRNFSQCSDYDAASARSATAVRRPYKRLLLGLYILDGCCSRKSGWVRPRCTHRRQFPNADSGYPASQYPG
jgi:hypothetical protein